MTDIQKDKQVVLIVLDGWGYRTDPKDNAVAAARKPNFDRLWSEYPHTLLEASGLAVGLPKGQMGNSEIGHMTIGAGKPIDTDLVRINKSIECGTLAENETLLALFAHVKDRNSTLHIQGLLSDGGVHSHFEHLFAILREAKAAGIERVAIHCFTDGRDTPPQSAVAYLKKLEETLEEVGIGFIATVSGRFYAMDRDSNWDRLEKVEKALFKCEGNVCHLGNSSVSGFIENLYKEGKTDELLEPIVCHGADGTACAIEPHDAVFFYNFRPDRARMLSKKILERATTDDILYATMTSYGDEYKCPVAFPAMAIETTLAKEIAQAGLTQAHIAETEKFPHATYFLNGGVEKPYENEEHVLLASRKDVQTHDQAPKMRAEAIADAAIERIEQGVNFLFINFANPDMVGHTANIPAIIEAVEETDAQMNRVVEALTSRGGTAIIIADHGNAEVNRDPITSEKHTAHTTNPVPCIITSGSVTLRPADTSCESTSDMVSGSLTDVTPTVFSLFGINQPATMTGTSLLA
jgi:2,3-bisphosphoglycerate-independent phosphoglycerate mutase